MNERTILIYKIVQNIKVQSGVFFPVDTRRRFNVYKTSIRRR